MHFNEERAIYTLRGKILKLMVGFTYFGRNISFILNEANKRLRTGWTAIDRLSIIWQSDIFDKIKRDFFQGVAVSLLPCACRKSSTETIQEYYVMFSRIWKR